MNVQGDWIVKCVFPNILCHTDGIIFDQIEISDQILV